MNKNIEIKMVCDRGYLLAWLGMEADNTAANEPYQSLKPTEKEPFISYTYVR
jgi:hypothetical protein